MEKEEMINPQREDGGSGFTRLFLTLKGKMNQYLSKAIKPPLRPPALFVLLIRYILVVLFVLTCAPES
jgi:hypothetical protein